MTDIIQLLPDSIANQIAAGEVVQRPASAVKELMENAIDADASSISLIIKDAGKTLIQVIDNGIGMSETDARLCLERHATSKIKKAEDLFSIRTMGFRGEAIASIAAIAHVEIRTKQRTDELGTKIIVEGSEVISQEPCNCAVGTTISIKNLFYNVPARRNFLKSNPVETKHIIEEFQRVALTNPQASFLMQHNGQEVMNLNQGSFRQRITGAFGDRYNKRLVPVKEETDVVRITGFVSKPEFAKKTRGEQYFFVNNRFIKSPYLHHAVQNAFQDLIQDKLFASYFLQMEIDPQKIDVNIHPTKTEVKFEDERVIYAIIRTAVKEALGRHNIAPSLDFDQEISFNLPLKQKNQEISAPQISVDPSFNPFDTPVQTKQKVAINRSIPKKAPKQDWEALYQNYEQEANRTQVAPEVESTPKQEQQIIDPKWEKDETSVNERVPMQLHNKYILTHIKNGLLLIDQHRAHERVMYERLQKKVEKKNNPGQSLLYPELMEVTPSDFELIKELKKQLHQLGFSLSNFGKNSFSINAVPIDLSASKAKNVLESILEDYKQQAGGVSFDPHELLLRSLAKKASITSGQQLSVEEMRKLIDELFACQMPYHTAAGKQIILNIDLEELTKRFQ